jgi:hypothetical protein
MEQYINNLWNKYHERQEKSQEWFLNSLHKQWNGLISKIKSIDIRAKEAKEAYENTHQDRYAAKMKNLENERDDLCDELSRISYELEMLGWDMEYDELVKMNLSKKEAENAAKRFAGIR